MTLTTLMTLMTLMALMTDRFEIFKKESINLEILHNLAKSCLIWMVLTFLKMAADSGSDRPIKVINSPLFNLALEDDSSVNTNS